MTKPFTVATPDLRDARDVIKLAIDDLKQGGDIRHANALIGAARGLTSVVSNDLRVRLQARRLADMETA